ncbi:glycoside hydrolase family 108 protein [Diaphorobacter caeni]|uniref:glycoside hydrolase family 108 protein n=1 Tax=Diaphorobacter caeni TaxID=2784387 RepID=UPI00188F080D|nr:glycosyl hydrolase 108 family protein [Diaphorobacter caeni]MBF5006828.1 hypothetical protein [Diaphorobacter caeni]
MSAPSSPSSKVWGSLGVVVLAIIGAVFSVEKGYVNDPKDPGGATNHGITEQVARAYGFDGDMRALPREFAAEVYAADYIEKPGFDRVIAMSPAVGEKLVDAGVNAGPSRSARWLQTALNHLSRGGADFPSVTADGRIGPRTLDAYRALERKRGRAKACELVLKLMDAQQATHYMSLNQPTFVVGWIDHRVGNVAPARCTESIATAKEPS